LSAMQRVRPWVGGVVVAALVLAGVSCSNDDGDKGKLKGSCGKIKCEGERGGARYKVQLPATWNGTLLIYSHGYRQAQPVPPNNDPVDTSAANAPSDEVAAELLKQGYALVGSSYKTNGYAVLDGVAANEDLYNWFKKDVGNPERVYVWGHSMGGLITQTFAEKHPDWVDGVIPMCGLLAGTNMNLDLGLDVTYALKTLGIVPELQLTDFASFDEAVANFETAYDAIMAAARDTKDGVPKLIAIGALTDAPARTKTYDGSDPVSSVSAAVEGLITSVGYGTFGRWEIEQRVGGNPSTNVDADYGSRIDADEAKLIETIAPGKLASIKQALDDGERVDSDPAARTKADGLGNPTGQIKDPTLTIHTAYDPLVLVQNERVFARRLNSASGRESDAVQLYTVPPMKYPQNPGAPYGAGHCNFTKDEHLGVVALLDDWVRNGVYPTGARITAQFPPVPEGTVGTHGVDLRYQPDPWPAEASD
jgi:pimeloyl-ACP methyl ester carboxylesterase